MANKITSQIFRTLQQRAGPSLEILIDQDDARFQEFARRWSDVDRLVPAAIILPESEEQIQKTVRWAMEASVPFVTRSGGHSNWSTIGDDGVIIDLSKYQGIDVDAQGRTARLRGSVLAKSVAVHLADAGFFTALGNGNKVGAIPYFLNGGASITTSITGYGSDQILAARMIDAQGNLIEVTQETEPELLYALRGAGQFFGLVTELTIKVWPLTALGNDQGMIWIGRFVFPLHRARDVAKVMKTIMDDGNKPTAGLMMAICPPPLRKPALVIAGRYIGNPDDAEEAFEPLYALDPLMRDGGPVPIQNASDGREALESQGGFKTFGVVGLRSFDIDRFLQTVEKWHSLIEECPDAINTTFNFQWDSRPPRAPEFTSANSLHDIRYWQNNINWYTNAASRHRVEELNGECIAIVRGPNELEYVDFANGTRTEPIDRRFRGEGKLAKLRDLKKKWDAQGFFTRQLLD